MSSHTMTDPVNTGVQAKDSSAELGRVGRVLAGLQELGTPEALMNRDKLSAFLSAWQHLAKQVQESKDQRPARARVGVLMRMLISVIDGTRCLLGFLDPALSAEIPIRSKVEDDDPVGFAASLIDLLQKRDGRAKQLAQDLQAVVAIVRTELQRTKAIDEGLAKLEDDAKVARLHMREFEAVCERFITQNTPKSHAARSKLKPKRTQKSGATVASGQGGAAQPSSPANDAPAPVAAVASIKAA